MHLFDIPVELLVELFAKYLTVQEVSVIDIAVCNSIIRPRFLEILAHANCVLLDAKILTKQKLAWLLSRNAAVNRLELRKLNWDENDFIHNNFKRIAQKLRILVIDGSSNILPNEIFLRCFENETESIVSPETISRERSRSHGHTPRNLVRKRHKMLKKSPSSSNQIVDEVSRSMGEKLYLSSSLGSNDDMDANRLKPLLTPECLSPNSPFSIANPNCLSPMSNVIEERRSIGIMHLEELHLTGFKKLFPNGNGAVVSPPASPAKSNSVGGKETNDNKRKVHSPEGLMLLFREYCTNIHTMNFSGCWDLSDTVLHGIVQRHCHSLRSLNVSACFQLTNEGLESLFTLHFPKLHYLNMSLCGQLSTPSLRLILKQLRSSVETLILNGCVQLSEDATFYIRANAHNLQVLDLGGIKNINDTSIAYLNGDLQPPSLIDDEYRAPEIPKNAMQIYPPRRFYVSDEGPSTLGIPEPQISLTVFPHLPLRSIVLEGCMNVSLTSLTRFVEIHAVTLKKLDMRYCSYSLAPVEITNTRQVSSNPLLTFLGEITQMAPALNVVLTRT